MALKKALVIGSDGLPEQLQAGDMLSGPFAESQVTLVTNGEAVPITVGQVIYMFADDTVKLAKANATGTSGVVGVVYDASIGAGATGYIITAGLLAGAGAGLTAGNLLFLSPVTFGLFTATPPATPGHYAIPVARAFNATDIIVAIGQRIKL